MFTKIFLVSAIVAAAYCQKHTYSLKTVVQHEQPQQEYQQHHQQEYQQHHEHIPVYHHQAAPVHEVQEPAYHHSAAAAAAPSQEQAQSYQNYAEEHLAQYYNSEHNSAPAYTFVPEHHEAQNSQNADGIHEYQSHHFAAPAQAEAVQQKTPQKHTVTVQQHNTQAYQEVAPVVQTVPQHKYTAVHQFAQHKEQDASSAGHDSHDHPIDYYAYPKYEYEYKIEDPHTGDNKYQHETRDGDVVKGVYSFHEADGSVRTVEYNSDKHNGFNAIVKHSAPGQHVHIESHHKN